VVGVHLAGIVVYAFLVLLLRVTGKRQVGQLAPFDLVLLLVLSNAVQNSMNGGDNSVTGGLISATTLIVLNGIVGRLTYKSKSLERIIEGRPEILIHNGKLYAEVLKREKLTHHELNAACAPPAVPVPKRCIMPLSKTLAKSPCMLEASRTVQHEQSEPNFRFAAETFPNV